MPHRRISWENGRFHATISNQVYRLIDERAVDHSGNREYRGAVFSDKTSAQALADKLNMEDGKDD